MHLLQIYELQTFILINSQQDQKQSELSINIFKKDDPTFETFKLLEEDQWRIYVSAYTRLPPTEDKIPIKRTFLKSNLKPLQDPHFEHADERTDEWRRRYTQSTYDGNLNLRIAVSQYKITFEHNTEEYLYQPLQVRECGQEGVQDAEAAPLHRDEQVADSLIINNVAMKGQSKDDVERKNQRFAQLVKLGNTAEGGETTGYGSEMED